MPANTLSMPRDGQRGARSGFTVIELLTVVFIIGLLVSIMLPSLHTARTHTRVTRTKAVFHSINTGLEMFHEDSYVGGDYPPSTWDTANNGDPAGLGGEPAQGAETLVWALLGADGLGTPGFDGNLGTGAGELYEVGATGPVHHRSGPFFNVSDVSLENVTIFVGAGNERDAKVIVDSFGGAILYYKAEPRMAEADPTRIYKKEHNLGFLVGSELNADGDDDRTRFNKYVQNLDIDIDVGGGNTLYRPHNVDTFLLISPGPDEEFGTKDDITNYPLAHENCDF